MAVFWLFIGWMLGVGTATVCVLWMDGYFRALWEMVRGGDER